MSSPRRRMETDVMKLLMSDHDVKLINDSFDSFYVTFEGPTETHYSGGIWQIYVQLPSQYPYKSPSIGFRNKIFHPNIDEQSGSVCLDVINQTWSPMFDLANIFEVFLPQLLRYPNPSDPLNSEAAVLLTRQPEEYGKKVKEYVRKYANKAVVAAIGSSSRSQAADEDGSESAAEEPQDGDDELDLEL